MKPLKNAWFKHWDAVSLVAGFHVSIPRMISSAAVDAVGSSVARGTGDVAGMRMDAALASCCPSFHDVGLPKTFAILYKVSSSDWPGKRGAPINISTIMQPTAQMSMALE